MHTDRPIGNNSNNWLVGGLVGWFVRSLVEVGGPLETGDPPIYLGLRKTTSGGIVVVKTYIFPEDGL